MLMFFCLFFFFFALGFVLTHGTDTELQHKMLSFSSGFEDVYIANFCAADLFEHLIEIARWRYKYMPL